MTTVIYRLLGSVLIGVAFMRTLGLLDVLDFRGASTGEDPHGVGAGLLACWDFACGVALFLVPPRHRLRIAMMPVLTAQLLRIGHLNWAPRAFVVALLVLVFVGMASEVLDERRKPA